MGEGNEQVGDCIAKRRRRISCHHAFLAFKRNCQVRLTQHPRRRRSDKAKPKAREVFLFLMMMMIWWVVFVLMAAVRGRRHHTALFQVVNFSYQHQRNDEMIKVRGNHIIISKKR